MKKCKECQNIVLPVKDQAYTRYSCSVCKSYQDYERNPFELAFFLGDWMFPSEAKELRKRYRRGFKQLIK